MWTSYYVPGGGGKWRLLLALSQGSFQMVQSPVGDPGHGWKEPLEQFGSGQGIPQPWKQHAEPRPWSK